MDPHARTPPALEVRTSARPWLVRPWILVVALLIATTGTAIAARPLLTGADIRDGSITGIDVRNGSIAGVDVRNGSITGIDVRDGSLRAADFRAGELPRGERGPTGPAGTVDIGPWRTIGTPSAPPFGEAWKQSTGAPVRFRIEGDVVRLAGQFAPSDSHPGGTWTDANRVLFVLPAGARPARELRIPVVGQQALEPGHVYVGPDGLVIPRGPTSGFGHLDGATFTIG
jgi:hypothetical protein